jgi:hypothetical protein
VSLEQTVTVFPREPQHRLVGPHLASFLDRVVERIVALGDGARARIRAGRFEGDVETLPDLLDTIDAARVQSLGREDLEVRLWGDARAPFARFTASPRVDVTLSAFVQPQLLLEARRCVGCGWPLDYDGIRGAAACNRKGCGEELAQEGELAACWSLRLCGMGADGLGERFVEEERRLEGSPFFEALEGAARTRLFEWQSWA